MDKRQCITSIFFILFLNSSVAWAIPISILNPSFEEHNLAIRQYTTGGLPGWNVLGFQGVFRPSAHEYNGEEPIGSTSAPAVGIPDGVNVAWSNGGTISQVLGDQLTAGFLYTLTVDVGNRLDMSFYSPSIALLAGGNVLASTSAIQPGEGRFVAASVSFLAPENFPFLGQPLEIRFTVSGDQVNYDNVRLDANPSSQPVPEPGTMLLFGAGIVGILRWRR